MKTYNNNSYMNKKDQNNLNKCEKFLGNAKHYILEVFANNGFVDPKTKKIFNNICNVLSEIECLNNNNKKNYMNVETGLVDNYSGWWYLDEETDTYVNGVEKGEVIEVVKDGNNDWVEKED